MILHIKKGWGKREKEQREILESWERHDKISCLPTLQQKDGMREDKTKSNKKQEEGEREEAEKNGTRYKQARDEKGKQWKGKRNIGQHEITRKKQEKIMKRMDGKQTWESRESEKKDKTEKQMLGRHSQNAHHKNMWTWTYEQPQ